MIAVSNTSPLVTLSRAGYVAFLVQLFEVVYIPEAVYSEIFQKDDEASRKVRELIERNFIKVKSMKNSDLVKILNIELGTGESEAIVLCRELKADYVLLDDLKARVCAGSFEIKVIGTLGLIRAMRRKDLIKDSSEEIYKRLKSANFWITRWLFLNVLKNAKSNDDRR